MHTGEVVVEVLHSVKDMVSGGTARNPAEEWPLPVGIICSHSSVLLHALLHPKQLVDVRKVEPLIQLGRIHSMVCPMVLVHALCAGILLTSQGRAPFSPAHRH